MFLFPIGHEKQVHHTEKPFSCKICSESFKLPRTLERHNLIHTKEKPYSCQICGLKFRYSWNKKSHEKGHVKSEKGRVKSKKDHIKSKKCHVKSKKIKESIIFDESEKKYKLVTSEINEEPEVMEELENTAMPLEPKKAESTEILENTEELVG